MSRAKPACQYSGCTREADLRAHFTRIGREPTTGQLASFDKGLDLCRDHFREVHQQNTPDWDCAFKWYTPEGELEESPLRSAQEFFSGQRAAGSDTE